MAILICFLFFVFSSSLVYIIHSPWLKGKYGEFKTNLVLSRLDGFLIKDIILPSINNTTTQIDHILITRRGIFVIETKHYKGNILGDPKNRYWIQDINGKTYEMYNPLFQNYKHLATIATDCGIDQKNIFSVVVFTGKAKVFVESNKVVYLKDLKKHILSKYEILFSNEEMLRIKEDLYLLSI